MSLNTVKSWKKRYGMTNRDRGAPKEKNVCTQKKVAPPVSEDDKTQEITLDSFLEDSELLTEKQRLFCLYYVRSF